MGLLKEDKIRAYKDTVEIVKAAYGSEAGYTIDIAPEFLQGIYDKLIELLEDAHGVKKD